MSYGDATVGYRWEFDGPVELMLFRAPAAAIPVAPAAMRPVLGRGGLRRLREAVLQCGGASALRFVGLRRCGGAVLQEGTLA